MDHSDSECLVPQRKRTRHACDQCRRRKTKCTGEAQCPSCSNASVACTYGSRTRHMKGVEYVAYLEGRVSRLKGGQSRKSSNSASSSGSSSTPSTAESLVTNKSPSASASMRRTSVHSSSQVGTVGEDPSTLMEAAVSVSVVGAVTSPSFAHRSTSVYYGGGSGIEVVRRVHSLCCQLRGSSVLGDSQSDVILSIFDRPFGGVHFQRPVQSTVLPPKGTTQWLIRLVQQDALPLWPFADQSFVELDLDHLCTLAPPPLDADDADRLALVYALVALGLRRLSISRTDIDLRSVGVSTPLTSWTDFVRVAHAMLPYGRGGQSLGSVQALMALAECLKSANATSACHACITAATAGALRIGLHEIHHASQLPEVERVRRERTYSALRIMDTMVSSSLGLPRSLRAESTLLQITPTSSQRDALAMLIEILGRHLDRSYSGVQSIRADNASYTVPYERVCEVGEELNAWSSDVAQIEGMSWPTKGRKTLDFCLFYVHLLIHAPLVHHLLTVGASVDAFACVTKAVDAAAHTVTAAEALDDVGALDAHLYAVEALVLAALVLRLLELSGTANAFRTVPSIPARRLLERVAVRNDAARAGVEILRALENDPTVNIASLSFATPASPNDDLMGPSVYGNLDPLFRNLDWLGEANGTESPQYSSIAYIRTIPDVL